MTKNSQKFEKGNHMGGLALSKIKATNKVIVIKTLLA